ncbi:MAG: cytochrome c3 family protein [Candidatus Angelobacter sp.]
MATSQSNSLASRICRWSLAVSAGLLLAGSAHSQNKNTCLDCHSVLTDNLGVTEEKFSQDIHAQKGLTCASCHGGDATSDDPEVSMGKKAGFKGKISRTQIPQLCGSCHSDPGYMRKYNPGLRTDQLSQYHTSIHGKRLATGDAKVAVCVDCHSVHDIRPPSDQQSTVNPVNVPNTCARCHADEARMKEYKIPTNQFAEYKKSVHHEALTVRGDLSAPTCVTCHGNHGATPPGASSVAAVCSTCHVFQAQLFDSSPHKAAFASAGLPGCVTCHSNHGILHPTDALIGTDDKAVCGQCHTEGDPGFVAANNIRDHLAQLAAAIDRSDQILSKAERSGMEVSEAKLDLVQARDTLTKARVTIHSANVERVQQDIKPGMVAAARNYEAGKEALKERNYRRFGLGLSLIAIAIVLVGLKLYLKQIESGQESQTT